MVNGHVKPGKPIGERYVMAFKVGGVTLKRGKVS
jgi:hypothetical protein